jgi:hypothetical protein
MLSKPLASAALAAGATWFKFAFGIAVDTRIGLLPVYALAIG